MQFQIRKAIIRIALVCAACLIAYLSFGWGRCFWMKHVHRVHNYKAEAESGLIDLRAMQENYRIGHGGYANNFEELGVPLGAQLQGDVMHFYGAGNPYYMRITRLVHDQNGTVVQYTIQSKPASSDGKLPTIEIDEAGIFKP